MKTTIKFLRPIILLLCILYTSCSKDTPATAKNVHLNSGQSQTAEVSTALINPIVIQVNDQNGDAFAGATVTFSVDEGAISFTTQTTNANGLAPVSWTLGSSVGIQTLTVTAFKADGTTPLTGSPISITATAIAQPAFAESIVLVSGNNQTTVVETELPNDIEIQVTDQYGNPFEGADLNFSVSEGLLVNTPNTTDENGLATVSWILGESLGNQTLMITGFKADGTTAMDNSPITVSAVGIRAITVGEFKYGGVVFYVDSTGQHGLVCAVNDLNMAEWGCMGVALPGASLFGLGEGDQNTLDILASCSTLNIAADICAGLELNGYTDWFLPSRNALSEMYFNKNGIDATATGNGGTEFVNDAYWSSTQYSLFADNQAYGRNFDNGNIYVFNKEDVRYVRPVRAF